MATRQPLPLLVLLALLLGAGLAVVVGRQPAAERAPQATGQVRAVPVPLPRAQGLQPPQGPAPDFVRETLDGRELALSELRGKPVVMNFWASWCVSCRAGAPILAATARRHQGYLHFLGVNVLDDPDDARRFHQQFSLPFPSVVDEEGSVLRAYRIVGLPTTVFITRSGRIFRVHPGPYVGPEAARDLEETVARLREEP